MTAHSTSTNLSPTLMEGEAQEFVEEEQEVDEASVVAAMRMRVPVSEKLALAVASTPIATSDHTYSTTVRSLPIYSKITKICPSLQVLSILAMP